MPAKSCSLAKTATLATNLDERPAGCVVDDLRPEVDVQPEQLEARVARPLDHIARVLRKHAELGPEMPGHDLLVAAGLVLTGAAAAVTGRLSDVRQLG